MKKILVLGIIAIFLAFSGLATTISDEDVTVDLEDNTVTAEIDVELLTTETFNYQTSHPVRNLNVEINGERADCEVEQLAVGSTINCETNLRENFTVVIEYDTTGLVTSQESINTFRYSQSIYRPIRNYTFKVLLPEGTGVVDQEDATTSVISPEDGNVGNVDGRQFFVEWNNSPELGRPQNFRVLFEPFQDNEETGSFIPGSLAALLVILGIVYFVYRRKSEVAASSVVEELEEDEKMIVEMLKESEGEMLQKDIVDGSHYSKAKISGVVSTLVEEEIVTKEKEGRSNKVSLEEKFKS